MKKMKLVLSCMMLLMLYIGPSLFAMSSCAVPIPAEPNMAKDFSLATEYEASEQSITSFTETLEEEDDVLFYPDAFTMDEMTATSSNQSQYHILDEVDDTWWELFPILLYFDVSDLMIDSIGYNLLSRVPSGALSVFNHTSDSWDVVIATLANGWNNGTLSDDYLPTGGDYNIEVLLSGSLSVDYFGIVLSIMTLADSEHYAESFSDVSDWSYMTSLGLVAGDYSITTDGDVATITISCNDTGNEYVIYATDEADGFSTNLVAEIRYKCGTGTNFYCYIETTSGNGFLASETTGANTWITTKILLSQIAGISPNGVITKIRIYNDDYDPSDTGNYYTYIDYLRVGPSNEMGWQHDASTVEGTEVSATASVSSDGDKLNMTVTGTSQYVGVVTDTTTTIASIDEDYYPFLKVVISDLSAPVTPRVLGESTSTFLDAITTAGTYRYNLKVLAPDSFLGFRFYLNDSEWLTCDLIKAYSIANWTVTQLQTETDDILYVDHGILVSDIDGSPEWFVLDYDPALSVLGSTYNYWNLSIADYTDIGAGHSWGFLTYSGGWATAVYDELSDEVFSDGIQTDMQFSIFDPLRISAITFTDMQRFRTIDTIIMYFDLPEWHVIASAVIIIWMELSTIGLDWFLIFLGLIMIPSSTIYIVKGGRKEASMDKVFFALVAFILGCALFIGGIM